MTSLKVQHLTKKYQKSKKDTFLAVDDISFEIQAGECFGLLGPNGAGKSTTINCVTGFYPPSSGNVLVNDLNVHTQPKAARKFLGVCPQEDTLDTDFNVLDQMVRHASFYRIPPAECRKRSEELLKRFQLDSKAHQPVEALSGGMRRRLQVARAMVSNPTVLILDEPTTGLDPDARRTLWDILRENHAQGMSTLLSTHYMDEAERLCDRMAILHQGKILDIDSPQNLIAKHIGNEIVEEEIRPGVIWKRAPNLEDVFLKLTGRGLGGEN